jgi:uncharacterized protein
MAKLFLIRSIQNVPKSDSAEAELLIPDLKRAESLLSRGIGLLPRRTISDTEALWITPGNNAHTFFMRFAIDCIFIDSKLRIQKIYSNLKPFRFVGPVWKARSFIETAAGQCDKWNIKAGDQLYVVD